MKKIIKKLIKNKNIQDKIRFVYNSIKSLNPHLIKEEISFRKNGLPDKLPYPNSKLIFTVIAIPWVSEYFKSGKIIYDNIRTSLYKTKVELPQNSNILDFGCGCGRLIRHFATENNYNLFGSDINNELINWCKVNLTFGNFSTNNILPPTNYENNFFDFIYARSVFTHLSEDYQKKWMNEIKRILKPNGVFYFTTHGKKTLKNLTSSEINFLNQKGIFEHNYFEEGDNKFSTYQTFEWTTQNLFDGFELLYYEEGQNDIHLMQDVFIVKKTNK
ncbi:MAG: class I SAM-dependent methyltransferase [Melioribacteraceae bacterium]|nr:class I SAM-dependent methyltransferase [Melioribacteraceae bacterium]